MDSQNKKRKLSETQGIEDDSVEVLCIMRMPRNQLGALLLGLPHMKDGLSFKSGQYIINLIHIDGDSVDMIDESSSED